MDKIKKLLQEKNILSHTNQDILVAQVSDADAGLHLAESLLSTIVTSQTLLLLSGGRTPKSLYQSLADSETIQPGAVGMVDERFGPKWHSTSNEVMLRDSGLLRYLEMRGIPFYPIINGQSREETAETYDEKLRALCTTYQTIVGVLGIGLDGHTAGIAGNRVNFSNPVFLPERAFAFVSDFDDQHGTFKERITMTFLGLSHVDILIVLVFGDDKKEALEAVFSSGDEKEVPGRFFTRDDIAPKTIFLTDQMV